MATVCLNMIVKNEAHVIRRCLDSVRPLIDHWVIVDTGSSDGTQDLIRELFKDIPGELFERPWKNFGHNRNEALDLARDRADYILFIDADETFVRYPRPFSWPELSDDAYNLTVDYGGTMYSRCSLISSRRPWRWMGVLHEYLEVQGGHSVGHLSAPIVFVRHDGARAHDPKTYERDAALLEAALLDEPNNTRYQFYLAQSYRDGHRFDRALTAYRRRVEMGGWEEEAWFALYQVAAMLEASSAPAEEVCMAYISAWERRPSRAEPLHALARFLRGQARYSFAAMIAERGLSIPYPKDDLLFIDRSVYDYRLLDEFSVAASYVPELREKGHAALLRLLKDRRYPTDDRSRIDANLKFYREVMPQVEARLPLVIDRKGAIGDLLMTLNFVEALKAHHPTRPIHYYCSPFYRELLTPLMRQIGIDEVCVAETLFDAIDSGQVGPVLSLGIYPEVEGYPEKPMRQHLLHYIASDMKLPPTDDLPALKVARPSKPSGLPEQYLTIHAKAGWSPYKQWPIERWTQVIAALPLPVVQVGGPDDPEIPGVVSRVNQSLFMNQLAVMAHARGHMGVDSWTNHVTHWRFCDAEGEAGRPIPAVIVWGSTQAHAAGYPHNRNLSLNLPCQPCFREDPGLSKAADRGPCINPPHQTWGQPQHACLMNLPVETVLTAVQEHLLGA